MDVRSRCDALKEKIAAELRHALDQQQKREVLIAGLYEVSRSVLHELGRPVKTREYQEGQGAVLELISFIAISLIRNASGDTRGVAVLAEIAEGSLDPQLQKKLSVYAQELLAKTQAVAREEEPARAGWFGWPALAGGTAVVLALYLLMPVSLPFKRQPAAVFDPVLSAPGPVPLAYQTSSAQVAPAWPVAAPPAPVRKESEVPAENAKQAPSEQKKGETPAETVTGVRIVNNQILVPVTLRNNGETVRAELVLDTGSTRTSIHEVLAGRLRIDLRNAKWGQAEVADGRTIHSRSASIDALGVGPISIAPMEVELIPYRGAEGLHDGLLGMDFLGRHRYQIDMEREVIRWF